MWRRMSSIRFWNFAARNEVLTRSGFAPFYGGHPQVFGLEAELGMAIASNEAILAEGKSRDWSW